MSAQMEAAAHALSDTDHALLNSNDYPPPGTAGRRYSRGPSLRTGAINKPRGFFCSLDGTATRSFFNSGDVWHGLSEV